MLLGSASHADHHHDANAQRNIHQLASCDTDPKTVIHTPAYPGVCQAVSHHPICHAPLQQTHADFYGKGYPAGNFQHDRR